MKKTITFIVMLCIIGMSNLTNAQEVKINNNFAVESDGTFRMDGAASVWNDIFVSPDATTKVGTKMPVWGGLAGTAFRKDAAGTSKGVNLWMFSATTEQEVYFTIQLPHSYKSGTNLFPRVQWTTATGIPDGSDVVWGLEYTVTTFGGFFPVTATVTGSTEFAATGSPSGALQHLSTRLGDIIGTTPNGTLAFNTVIVCRLYRAVDNASDTFSNEVGLLGFDFLYESDTQGSRGKYNK